MNVFLIPHVYDLVWQCILYSVFSAIWSTLSLMHYKTWFFEVEVGQKCILVVFFEIWSTHKSIMSIWSSKLVSGPHRCWEIGFPLPILLPLSLEDNQLDISHSHESSHTYLLVMAYNKILYMLLGLISLIISNPMLAWLSQCA